MTKVNQSSTTVQSINSLIKASMDESEGALAAAIVLSSIGALSLVEISGITLDHAQLNANVLQVSTGRFAPFTLALVPELKMFLLGLMHRNGVEQSLVLGPPHKLRADLRRLSETAGIEPQLSFPSIRKLGKQLNTAVCDILKDSTPIGESKGDSPCPHETPRALTEPTEHSPMTIRNERTCSGGAQREISFNWPI